MLDAMSETLRVVHLTGATFIDRHFIAPWCYGSSDINSPSTCVKSGLEAVVMFYMLTEGECFLEFDGQAAAHLVAGDAIVLPQGGRYRMTSKLGLVPKAGALLDSVQPTVANAAAGSQGDAQTKVICGQFNCDARLAKILLAGLPQIVRVNVRGADSGPWLEASLQYALREARSPRPGGAGVLGKLAEVLFIEVLRLYMNEKTDVRQGWIAGLRDRVVGAALNALHRDPTKPWTLEDLAQEAGASRSVLAERFQQLVGNSPIQYLTQWRMYLAANLLGNSNIPLARIAEEVGYQTDTAFSRAFRREYGTPPAAWRRKLSNRQDKALPTLTQRSNQGYPTQGSALAIPS